MKNRFIKLFVFLFSVITLTVAAKSVVSNSAFKMTLSEHAAHLSELANPTVDFIDLNYFIFGDEDIEEDDDIFISKNGLRENLSVKHCSAIVNILSYKFDSSQKIPLYILYKQLKTYLL